MAKRGNKSAVGKAKKQVREDRPPRLLWRQDKDQQWIPIMYIGNIVIPGEPRPFMGFREHEREAMLTWVKQMLSEIFFDCPCLIVNEKTGVCAKNPDWSLLPFFVEKDGEYYEVTPEPSMTQEEAAKRLPSGT